MTSRRERSKREKAERIQAAARRIFRAKGFEAATTREIAEQADVGTGTLFLHAGDKGALLMSLVNADLAALSDGAVRALRSDAGLVEQLVAFFRSRYEYWASDPALARAAFREMSARDGSKDLRGAERRALIGRRITALVAARNARLPAAKRPDPDDVAALFTAIYLGEVRLWLHNDVLDVASGIARLRRLLTLAMHGLKRS